jgi:hypothetical protein
VSKAQSLLVLILGFPYVIQEKGRKAGTAGHAD